MSLLGKSKICLMYLTAYKNNEVHYNPWVEPPYQGFCKLTLDNGDVIELEGSGTLTDEDEFIYSRRLSVVSAEIGEACTTISNSAFQGCSNLTSVTIGSCVTSIMNNSFRYCSSLTSITSLAVTAPTIVYTTFREVGRNGILTVPKNSFGYDNWIRKDAYYLGQYNWTIVEQ